MIERYLKRIAKDTAVYWGGTTMRADGTMGYGAPVEIPCLWKEGYLSDPDRDAQSITVKAQVYLLQDVAEGAMLFKGKLTDLTEDQKSDPRHIDDAYEITKFVKTPSLAIHGKFNRYAIIAPEISRIPPGIERS